MMQTLLAGGGRGGEVRLKLYLSLLWASPGGQNETEFGASDWAQLLGLPSYSRSGKRRIYEASDWLEENHFILKERRGGRTSVLRILDESGTGEVYEKPSDSPVVGGAPSYRRLQYYWWTAGWMAVASGRALAFWLALMDETNNGTKSKVWLAESVTADRYGFSSYLRQESMRDLKELGLITTSRKFMREPFGVRASRTVIDVDVSALQRGPRVNTFGRLLYPKTNV